MKIILLRHEEREDNVGFYSNLNEHGMLKSIELIKTIHKLDKKYKITDIYSSVFIRTLQTIYPYAQHYKKKINIEHGLYEYLHNPYFLLSSKYGINDINDIDLKTIVDTTYKSSVNIDDLPILENEQCLSKRICMFFDSLDEKYNKKHKNICLLLVSHKGVINKIKDIYFKKTNMNDDFPMGRFEIYDYTPANALSPA